MGANRYITWRLYKLNLLRRTLMSGLKELNQAKKHKSINKSTWRMWLDLMGCHFRYDANLLDYISFEYYRLPHAERDSFLTTYRGVLYSLKVNDQQSANTFHDKPKFNSSFSQFVSRQWIDTRVCSKAQIEEFIALNGSVIAKPFNGTEGYGIFIVHHETAAEREQLLSNIDSGQHYILEELLRNHPDIAKLNPHALNTLRIVTITDKDKNVHLLCTVIRIGGSGSIIDNLSQGGIVCPIDAQTGKICQHGIDLWGKKFTHHPESHIELSNYQIPLWQQVINTVKEAATKTDGVRYVGWDIAVTSDGRVEIIEANPSPGVQLLQSDGKGRWNTIKRISI